MDLPETRISGSELNGYVVQIKDSEYDLWYAVSPRFPSYDEVASACVAAEIAMFVQTIPERDSKGNLLWIGTSRAKLTEETKEVV